MIRTRVGYAGGTTPAPTYRDIGDHSETIEIDFDPEIIDYAQLLDLFWKGHQPQRRSWSRQYMSAVFVHNEAQRRLAEATQAAFSRRLGKTIHTRILPFTGFTRAEDYHQKYFLKGYRDIYREIQARYDTERQMTDATAAARVNGFLGGYGSVDDVTAVERELALSPGTVRRLKDAAGTANH